MGFDPEFVGSCSIEVYIPDSSHASAPIAHYVVDQPNSNDPSVAGFRVAQAIHRGQWVSVGDYRTTGGFVVRLDDRGDGHSEVVADAVRVPAATAPDPVAWLYPARVVCDLPGIATAHRGFRPGPRPFLGDGGRAAWVISSVGHRDGYVRTSGAARAEPAPPVALTVSRYRAREPVERQASRRSPEWHARTCAGATL